MEYDGQVLADWAYHLVGALGGRLSDDVVRLVLQRVEQARVPAPAAGHTWSGVHTLLRGRPPVSRDARLAPTPSGGHRLLGHHGFAGESVLDALVRWRDAYGDVVRLRFGLMTAHVISDPELVRQVLQERHRIYQKTTRGVYKLRLVLGLGLLTSDGDYWLRHRRIAQPAFHRRRIAGFADCMVGAAAEEMGRWTPDERFDLHASMMRLTLRVVADTLLGADIAARVAEEVAAAVDTLVADTHRRINSIVDLPLHVPTFRNLRFTRAVGRLDEIVLELVRERRRNPQPTDDLLSMLLEARDEETGESMDDAQLRDEVMTIFLAGHETTANALTWSLYLLSLHPDVRRRLEQEVDRVLEGRAPGHADFALLPYTKQVIQEAMRLYPPAWMTARTPTQDDELGGFFIPKESLVFVCPWVVHRHPDHWQHPEGFDPDRFAERCSAGRHRYAYFPFGGGPRVCIGQGFAMLEAVLILAAITQRWRLNLYPGFEAVPDPLITLRPRGGVPVIARTRSQAQVEH